LRVPTKKKSCELVQQAIAGPAAGDVMEAIRAEYWLPQDSRQKPQARKSEPTPETTEPSTPKTSPQVKP
jgi:hypothetical protein